MMKTFGHKVDKYALIHSSASEILQHMKELNHCSDSNSYFHVLQMEKAAIFIQFVEDIYIIPGSEIFTSESIKSLWNILQDPKSSYGTPTNMPPYANVYEKVNEYQKRINGKFLTTTAPF